MPEMNGLEMCSAIKKDKDINNTPVILLTTLSDTEDIIHGLRANADCYITKPYKKNHLLAKIDRLLSPVKGQNGIRGGKILRITLGGKEHVITANRAQIMNLLISTYENTLLQYKELKETKENLSQAYDELHQANSELLQLVMELEDSLSDCKRELKKAKASPTNGGGSQI